MTRKNYIGRRFGKLLVLKRAPDYVSPGGAKLSMYEVLCDCGTKAVRRGTHIGTGRTRSCGCWNAELVRKRSLTHGYTVGRKSFLPAEYATWERMKHRCSNPKLACYKNYGGRGISVSEVWRDDFAQFLKDMGKRPSGKHSIDRIDNDGNYGPGNCRWATAKEQNNNRRPTRRK